MRKDIDLNFVPHPLTGDLSVKRGVSAVDQSVKNLILTNFYERGFNVNLAGDLQTHLFDVFDVLTKESMLKTITNLLNVYEPNVELVDLTANQDESGHILSINIFYTYANDPNVNQLSVPIRRLR